MTESVRISDLKRSFVVRKVDFLRRALNLTEQELGAIMGISATSVSRRLRGAVPFSREELRRFAAHADTEEGWFDA